MNDHWSTEKILLVADALGALHGDPGRETMTAEGFVARFAGRLPIEKE